MATTKMKKKAKSKGLTETAKQQGHFPRGLKVETLSGSIQ